MRDTIASILKPSSSVLLSLPPNICSVHYYYFQRAPDIHVLLCNCDSPSGLILVLQLNKCSIRVCLVTAVFLFLNCSFCFTSQAVTFYHRAVFIKKLMRVTYSKFRAYECPPVVFILKWPLGPIFFRRFFLQNSMDTASFPHYVLLLKMGVYIF